MERGILSNQPMILLKDDRALYSPVSGQLPAAAIGPLEYADFQNTQTSEPLPKKPSA